MITIKANYTNMIEIEGFMEKIKSYPQSIEIIDIYLKAINISFSNLEKIRFEDIMGNTRIYLHSQATLFDKLLNALNRKISHGIFDTWLMDNKDDIYSKFCKDLNRILKMIGESFDPICEVLTNDDLDKREMGLLLRAFWEEFRVAFNNLNFEFELKRADKSRSYCGEKTLYAFYKRIKQIM